METITIMASYNIEKVKDIARYLAGIKKELPRIRRQDLVKFFKAPITPLFIFINTSLD